MIHRTRVNTFGLMFCFLGSFEVITAQNQSIANMKSGSPKTVKALLLKPFASFDMPKCVAITSGRRFQRRTPTKIGSNVTMLVKINVFLFVFSIRIASLQAGQPEHDLFENSCIQLIINVVLLLALINQISFFENFEMV